jgi:hypothetical protein
MEQQALVELLVEQQALVEKKYYLIVLAYLVAIVYK